MYVWYFLLNISLLLWRFWNKVLMVHVFFLSFISFLFRFSQLDKFVFGFFFQTSYFVALVGPELTYVDQVEPRKTESNFPERAFTPWWARLSRRLLEASHNALQHKMLSLVQDRNSLKLCFSLLLNYPNLLYLTLLVRKVLLPSRPRHTSKSILLILRTLWCGNCHQFKKKGVTHFLGTHYPQEIELWTPVCLTLTGEPKSFLEFQSRASHYTWGPSVCFQSPLWGIWLNGDWRMFWTNCSAHLYRS